MTTLFNIRCFLLKLRTKPHFVFRYVTVLDVASIKPDAESLEASVDWDPNAPFHHSRIGPQFQFDLSQQVAELSKVLARRGPRVAMDTPIPAEEVQAMTPRDVGRGSSGGRTADSPASGRGRGRGRGRGKGAKSDDMAQLGAKSEATPGKKGRRRTKADDNVKHGESSKTAGSKHAERSDSKRKGDEEFEAQIAMALAATAAAAEIENTQTNAVTSEKEENSVKGLSWSQPQSNGGKSKIFERGAKGNTSGSVWSWKMGPLLRWAEVYCGSEGSSGR